MISLNHYQKIALIFSLLIRAFSNQTKAPIKLKMLEIKNFQHYVNGLLIKMAMKSMTMKVFKKSMQKLNIFIDKTNA